MAFIQCDCFSEALGVGVSIWAVLPQRTSGRMIGMSGVSRGDRHPTLYLLHGLSDDHTIWMRRTSIERYATEAGLAVIMPAVNRSFYTDMEYGYRYWQYVSDELLTLSRQFFPLSDKREDTFVAGLSMGGYGAFKLALSCPQTFAAGASLSGALDIAHRDAVSEELLRDYTLVFGDGPHSVEGTPNDLLFLAKELADGSGPKPQLYQWCGTEDFLYQQNRAFKQVAEQAGLDLTYAEGPGDHSWRYWDLQIQKVIDWLPM